MSSIIKTPPPAVQYPDSDGQPMADNTLQFEWIVTLQGNIDLMFHNQKDVFVAGDHLIYPVEGNADIRQAPDVYVAFGRPKGHRGSYKVFEEDHVFPQVIFEVWSPGNRFTQMEDKRDFYARYGAEEYYIVYPEFPAHDRRGSQGEPAGGSSSQVDGWLRKGEKLERVENMNGHISPRLDIRFELHRGNIAVYHPDGRRFLSYVELGALQHKTQTRAETAEQHAEEERLRAEQERLRAEEARQKAERLAARLRELGVDPDTL